MNRARPIGPCFACYGTGKVSGFFCPYCGGDGRAYECPGCNEAQCASCWERAAEDQRARERASARGSQ